MSEVAVTVNGSRHVLDVDADTPLVWVIRDALALTGTKFGCGVGVCGACTILENGSAVRGCQNSCSEGVGRSFFTIEGLTTHGKQPCQRGWPEEDVAQCGYCQPGMIMTACALLKAKPNPTDREIDDAMSDSVCRCGTYPRMRKAIRRAAEAMKTRQR